MIEEQSSVFERSTKASSSYSRSMSSLLDVNGSVSFSSSSPNSRGDHLSMGTGHQGHRESQMSEID